MDEINKNIDYVVGKWLESSDNNYLTLNNMIKSKDYIWALFMGHLVLEKILKAIFVKKLNKHPLFTHDLLLLATRSNLELSEEYIEWLDTITTFNINARYDNYKQDFYKLCTKEFTDTWINRIEILRRWLMTQF